MMGDKRKAVTAILGPASPGVGAKGDDSGPDDLEVLAEELIDAFHSKDAALVAAGLRAVFDKLDSEPHVEGPHIED